MKVDMEGIVGQVVQANGSPPRLASNDLVASLRLTVEWIGNLERMFGSVAVINQMPNNFGGRAELEQLIQEWGKEFNEPGEHEERKVVEPEERKLSESPRHQPAEGRHRGLLG